MFLLDLLEESSAIQSEICVAQCLSHVLHIAVPTLRVLNTLLFQGHLNENLELGRKQRVDLRLDRNLVIYLCVRNECVHNYVITETVFSSWFNRGMMLLSSDTNVLNVLTHDSAFQGSHRIVCKNMCAYFRMYVMSLKWRKRRKRRRFSLAPMLGSCGVCYEECLVIKTKCDHHFCRACIDAWNKSTCPICRLNHYV